MWLQPAGSSIGKSKFPKTDERRRTADAFHDVYPDSSVTPSIAVIERRSSTVVCFCSLSGNSSLPSLGLIKTQRWSDQGQQTSDLAWVEQLPDTRKYRSSRCKKNGEVSKKGLLPARVTPEFEIVTAVKITRIVPTKMDCENEVSLT